MPLADYILPALMAGSMTGDIETTMGRRELNPVMQPFAHSRAQMYGVKGGVNLGVAILSHKLRRSPRKAERILGWALPVFAIGVQSAAAAHNAARAR